METLGATVVLFRAIYPTHFARAPKDPYMAHPACLQVNRRTCRLFPDFGGRGIATEILPFVAENCKGQL